MAITVKHSKVSTIPDDTNTDLVRPSDWNADHVLTGTVPIANGGTGQSTANDALNTLLPDQTGNAGKVLTTDGTNTNWSTNGVGDVVGPASATDNAITRFDGTTGKLIQNSLVTIGDTGIIAGATAISNINYVDFDTTYATTLTEGQLGWDGNNTLGLGMAGGNVIQHIGEDQFFYCKASSAITKGQVVMFTGAVGASGVPTGAPATGISDGTYIMGIAAEAIATNGFGLVQSFGSLRNVNTSGYSDGDILWYNPSVTGGLTKTQPSAPSVKVQMAAVINGGSSGGGTILIRINPGSTLGGTDSNAQITSVANGQILTYDGGNGYWKNTDLGAGTGINVTETVNGVLSIVNTAPDQTVVLNNGTGISVTGTYPNFTITNTSPSSGGTVTSITAGTGLTGGTITGSGTIAIDSTVATLTGTQTLTNKRVTLKIGTVSSSGTITPTSDTADQYNVTALATTAAFAAPSGTPTDGQKLTIRIKDSGSGQTMSWTGTTGGYRAIGVTLPTSIAASKTIYVGCIWNAADSFWDVVSVATQA